MEPANESQLLREYMEEVKPLMLADCHKLKSKAFTEKYINRQIHMHKPQFHDANLAKSHLLDQSACRLQTLIAERQLSYHDLVQLYHEVKQQKGNAHNSLTWSFHERPLQSASQIDARIEDSGEPHRVVDDLPLTGFVMSIKECLYMKDCPNTCGIHINLDRVPTREPSSSTGSGPTGP